MKNKVLLALMVMVVKSTLVIAWTTVKPPITQWTSEPTTTSQWTTGDPRANLNGKMLMLSLNQEGITFFPPNYSPSYSSTFHRPWSTASPTTGWSVCLRYLTDSSTGKIFTFCPSCQNPITLSATSKTSFRLSNSYTYGSYLMSNFVPNIHFLLVSELDIWTRVCVTVDTVKQVAQLFSGSNMSIRKMLSSRYSWTGEPVIRISEFEGQVTDIQMWDYPLNYREVSNYMNYREYRGSILTWSDISYFASRNMILEDVYEVLAKEPISRRRKGHRFKGGKKTGRGFTVGENKL